MINHQRNKKGNFKPYQLGEKVWLEGTNLKTSHPYHKLAAQCHGPFKVTQCISAVVYELELPPQWQQKQVHPVFHTSLLSPYHETEEHGRNFPEPPPDIIEGQEEYEVVQIKDVQCHTQWKKKYYLVS